MNAEPNRASFAAHAVPRLFRGNSFHPPRPVLKAMRRGFAARCPACGQGELFGRFLQRRPRCEACGERFDAAEPDGLASLIAAPFGLLVGGALSLLLDALVDPPLWLTLAVCESVAVWAALRMAQRSAGLTLGLAWAVRLRGFDPSYKEAAEPEKSGATLSGDYGATRQISPVGVFGREPRGRLASAQS